MKRLVAILLFTVPLVAQAPRQVRFVTTNPSGTCGASYITQNTVTGVLTGCVGGTWTTISTAGGVTTTAGATFGAFPYDFLASTVSLPPVFVRTDTSFTMTAGKTGIFTPAAAFPAVQLIAGANPTGNWPGALNIDLSGGFNWSPSNAVFQKISTAATANRTFALPDANSNSVIPDTGATNNFLTAISAGGVISKAQPTILNLSTFSSANLATQLTDESGTGVVCFTVNCSMTNPALGTPSALVLTNATGFPAETVSCTNALFDLHFTEGSGTAPADFCASATGTFAAGARAPTWTADGSGISLDGTQSLTVPVAGGTIKTLVLAYRPDPNALKTKTQNFAIIGSPTDVNTSMVAVEPKTLLPWIGTGAANAVTKSNYKSAGTVITCFVYSNPGAIYQNGVVSGYPLSGNTAPTGSTTFTLGDFGAAPNAGYGFPGQLMWATGYSTFLTQAECQKATAAIRYNLLLKSATIQDSLPDAGVIQVASDGDSIAASSGATTPDNTWTAEVVRRFPVTINITDVALSGATLQGRITTATTAVDSIVKKFSTSKRICSIAAGSNDLQAARTTTQVYGDARTYATARRAVGCKTIVSTITSRSGIDANAQTVNGCIRDGFIGSNAGCGGSQLDADAVNYAGFDHLMGITSAYTNTSCFPDNLHPGNGCNALWAMYEHQAILGAAGQGGEVSLRFTITTSGSNFTLAANGQTAITDDAKAAALTQSIPLYFIGPKTKVLRTSIKSTTVWAGTTTLTAKIGDSVGGVGYYDNTAYDLKAAVSNTNFQDSALSKSATWAGSNITLDLTATVDNLSSIASGVVDVTIVLTTLP